jgi:uncharacterized membrane protein
MGSREADIARLYCSRNMAEAQEILSRYGIRYVFVGNLERSAYAPGQNTCPGGLNETKFTRGLDLVFKQGSIAVYAVP